MKIIKSLTNCYNKMSNFGKILVFIALLLVVVSFFKSFKPMKEGMTTNVNTSAEKFVFKQGTDVYDDFYVNIYDYLVFNRVKNDYEVGTVMNSTTPTAKSVIADIGCGTGHQVYDMDAKNLEVVGIDISPSMIAKAKANYPNIKDKFKVGDGLDGHLFQADSLTHLLCLNFTIYYMKDKIRFFYNCMDWLMPGGYLVLHLVDKYKFDPILQPDNPLYIVTPQKHTKERITSKKITFNDFVYNSNFKLEDDIATLNEKFKFNDGKVRQQEQVLYMEDLPVIVNMVQDAGFIIHAKIDMVKCAYENQYLYIFTKPS
jgi:SAM-dependent methyltransferase